MQVDEIEGRTVAIQYGCQFYEVSVAENSSTIYTAFDLLLGECRSVQGSQKTRKFSVSKMIGTLIGNNNGKVMPNTNQGGTVVVCQKSDLYKSRVLKRRHNFTATASLWLIENEEQPGSLLCFVDFLYRKSCLYNWDAKRRFVEEPFEILEGAFLEWFYAFQFYGKRLRFVRGIKYFYKMTPSILLGPWIR